VIDIDRSRSLLVELDDHHSGMDSVFVVDMSSVLLVLVVLLMVLVWLVVALDFRKIGRRILVSIDIRTHCRMVFRNRRSDKDSEHTD
jgi:hypothetical protein